MGTRRVGKILVIDDDAPLRANLVAKLRHALGATVLAAGDVATASDLAARHEPDAAIVDMRLPDGDGIDLIASMRARSSTTVLLLASGHNSIYTTVLAMRAGANDVLTKPFTIAEIAERITNGKARSSPGERVAATAERNAWEHAQRVFREAGCNITRAAEILDVDRNTVKRWLRMRPPPE